MLDNESFGRGVFQPELTNPEHSNADSTALWELQLLARCYHGDAEVYCKHIMGGAPSHGAGALPQKMLQRFVVVAFSIILLITGPFRLDLSW